ncbi:hypothetical protein EIO60_02107|nr:hypothetical protein [Candidatus Pantoea persica]
MVAISGHGANRRLPFFYSRVKGEMKTALRHQGWPRLTLIRPLLLLGGSQARRESLMATLFNVLPGNWLAVSAQAVARCMHERAFQLGGERLEIIESDQIPR